MSKFYYLKFILVAVFLSVSSSYAWAISPFLAFSDVISGPASGLGDGRGQGMIVTVWGQNLGSSQGTSKIFYEDSEGETRQASYVYYWKNADGVAPSGPANLFQSHRMQEVAFSIPESALGKGTIFAEVNGVKTNPLDFSVRPGSIFFVSSKGNDSTGDGSFENSWQTVSHADSAAPKGSTIYILDVDTGDRKSSRAIYWNNTSASSSLEEQFSIIAYPGYQPKVIAQKAVENYTTSALVVSKLDIYASNYLAVDSNDQPIGTPISNGDTYGIQSSRNGRAIGNRIGDIPGGCASKWNAAINGNANVGDRVSNFKGFGNEIYDYGCDGTDKLHHTIYLSVRSGDGLVVEPWEWGYNYLHGNKAKFGIHQYDEGTECGDLAGPLRIYNNVIIDQSGSGISVGSTCGWSMDIYIHNNVIINVGLAADWDGIDPDTSNGAENGGIGLRDRGLLGTAYIRNNLIYMYSEDGQTIGGRGCLNLTGIGDYVQVVFQNNICFTTMSQPFIGFGYSSENKSDNIRGSNNIWIDQGQSKLTPPTWDNAALTNNPDLKISGSFISVNSSSPIVDSGISVPIKRGIYGTRRDADIDIGPIEFSDREGVSPPESPTNLFVE